MDPILFTPRLKLTLITKAERGSPELEWLHELRCDPQSTRWSISGSSKTIEDTEKFNKILLPTDDDGDEGKTYRVIYAVHEIQKPTEKEERPTRFAGTVSVTSWGARNLVMPEQFTLPTPDKASTLYTELAYAFLPAAWGKGYASEALRALFEACGRARSFWAPYERVHMRAIVNDENPGSQRVMNKTDAKHLGIYVWTGNPVWLNEQWTTRSELHIYGKFLLE